MSTKTKTTVVKEVEMGKIDDSPQIKIAVMNSDIKHMNDTLVRIENKFDTAIQGFVTTDKLSDVLATADAKHVEQDKAIKSLQDWNVWAVRIFAGALLTGVISFIVYLLLQRIK